MVLRSKGGDPLTDLVLRSSPEDPLMVCYGKTFGGSEMNMFKHILIPTDGSELHQGRDNQRAWN